MLKDRNGKDVKVGDVIHGPAAGCAPDHELLFIGEVVNAVASEDESTANAVIQVACTRRFVPDKRGDGGRRVCEFPYPNERRAVDVATCVLIE